MGVWGSLLPWSQVGARWRGEGSGLSDPFSSILAAGGVKSRLVCFIATAAYQPSSEGFRFLAELFTKNASGSLLVIVLETLLLESMGVGGSVSQGGSEESDAELEAFAFFPISV